MNIYTGIGLLLVVAGGLVVVRTRPRLSSPPAGKDSARYGRGLDVLSIGCIMMNVGSLTSDAHIALKVASTVLAGLLLVVLVDRHIRSPWPCSNRT